MFLYVYVNKYIKIYLDKYIFANKNIYQYIFTCMYIYRHIFTDVYIYIIYTCSTIHTYFEQDRCIFTNQLLSLDVKKKQCKQCAVNKPGRRDKVFAVRRNIQKRERRRKMKED